ncbi:pirin family protein [Fusobacterium canifelinum]|uniref:Pirin family protein n=1 Tax=Fusobacterium canifelinum TaxID=285729 RepID=A0A7T4FPL8_9FUSO|nr:pirin family protein [Fusobacterium canifelinum]QQB74371.1 pirin family protein [Fusobacterium canifelinum]
MNNYRPIERVFKGLGTHWVGDGFLVNQYFPKGQERGFAERFSPFLLMDYNEPYYFEATDNLVGVGAHPHRGFETVTIALAGKVEHHDNKGNHGVIEAGDIQWMTAGSGILHKEYHEREYSKKGRVFHMIQLWVDLPREYKMTNPRYQTLLKGDMGKVILENNIGEIDVYAGEVKGVKGPAKTFSPINMYKLTLNQTGKVELNEPVNFNTGALVVSGSIKVNEEKILEQGEFILFENKEGTINFEALSEEAMMIVLSGEPLNQPVVAYGPFVMTTEEDIIQANIDFQQGLFGTSKF